MRAGPCSGARAWRASCTSSIERKFARLRRVPLRVPALELPGDVALLAGDVAEAHRVGVDVVQIRENVDERLTGDPSLRHVVALLGHARIVQDVAAHEVHHVERRSGDVLVLAVAERRRRGNPGGVHRRDEAPLARHVVRGREEFTQGRTPKDEKTAGRVGDLIREVGVPTLDPEELQRWDDLTDVRDQPIGDRCDFDPRRLVAHVISSANWRDCATSFPSRLHSHPSSSMNPPCDVWVRKTPRYQSSGLAPGNGKVSR